jgi:DNA invertase Pin-like site-specific DNA recombinase
LKAILYAAKSTKDPRGSIPTQLEDGRVMAARESWEIVGEYADEDATGWKGDRGPGLAAAMAHAERIAPCVLVIQHSDRLARGDGRQARHLGEIYFWSLKADLQIRSVQDDSTWTNPLLAFAMGERNAEDSRRKSLAVAAGMKRLVATGRPSGGPRPYGYRYEHGNLVDVDAEGTIVARIFAEFVAGRSLSEIARGLHRDRVPTLRGRLWRQSTVSGILTNPVYVGRIRYDGEIYGGQHKPLVNEATWNKAQELIAARPTSKGRGRPPKGRHLFRGGMLRCECGEAIVPRTNGGYEMYYCNGRSKLGLDFCNMPHVRRADIDGAVYRYFEQVALDVEATRQTIFNARNRKLAEIRALYEQAEQEARRAEERLARVRRDYADGRLDAEDWREFRTELSGEREAARAEAERLGGQLREVERWGELRDAEAETLRTLAELRALIAGEINDAGGLDALRAVLARTFDYFILRREAQHVHVELIVEPELVIEPVVRERAIEGHSEHLRPILRREPLAETNNASASRCGPTSHRPSTEWRRPPAPTGSRS